MSHMRTRIVLISVAMFGAAGFATVASAEDRVPDQRSVYSRDIDFNKPSQVRVFYRRLQDVAHEVCQSEISDPRTRDADKACEAQAVSDAVRDVNQPQLSRLDDEKNGRTASTMAWNDRSH